MTMRLGLFAGLLLSMMGGSGLVDAQESLSAEDVKETLDAMVVEARALQEEAKGSADGAVQMREPQRAMLHEGGYGIPPFKAADELVARLDLMWDGNRRTSSKALWGALEKELQATDPTRRACALVLAAQMPVQEVRKETLQAMAQSLGEGQQALVVLNFNVAQSYGQPTRWPYDRLVLPELVGNKTRSKNVTVGEVARMALQEVTGTRFSGSADVKKWLEAQPDLRRQLWYWMRVGKRPNQVPVPLHLTAEFGKLPDTFRFKVLFLSKVQDVLQDEAAYLIRQGPVPAGDPACRLGPRTYLQEFIAAKSIRPVFLTLLRGESPWPEFSTAERGRELAEAAFEQVRMKPAMVTAEDLEQVVDAPSLAGERFRPLKAGLVVLLCRKRPEQAETLLVAHLEKDPALVGLVPELVTVSGFKHDALLEKSLQATRGSEQYGGALMAVAELRTPEARAFLARLFRPEELRLVKDDKGKLKGDLYQTTMLWCDLANAVAGQEVITRKEMVDAVWPPMKGNRKDHEEQAKLIEARGRVLAKLEAFFATKGE